MLNLSNKSLSAAITEYIGITPLTTSNLRYKINRIKRLRSEPRYNLLRPSTSMRTSRESGAALNCQDDLSLMFYSKDEQVIARLMKDSTFEQKMNFVAITLLLVCLAIVVVMF